MEEAFLENKLIYLYYLSWSWNFGRSLKSLRATSLNDQGWALPSSYTRQGLLVAINRGVRWPIGNKLFLSGAGLLLDRIWRKKHNKYIQISAVCSFWDIKTHEERHAKFIPDSLMSPSMVWLQNLNWSWRWIGQDFATPEQLWHFRLNSIIK